MSDTRKSPQKQIHPFKISDLHDIYVSGNLGVWDAEINRLWEFLLSGIALKPTEHQKFALQHLLVDDPITTVEQFNKLIGDLESVWVGAPVEDSSPEKKARFQKSAGIQPDAKSIDKDDLATKTQKPIGKEGTQSSNAKKEGI